MMVCPCLQVILSDFCSEGPLSVVEIHIESVSMSAVCGLHHAILLRVQVHNHARDKKISSMGKLSPCLHLIYWVLVSGSSEGCCCDTWEVCRAQRTALVWGCSGHGGKTCLIITHVHMSHTDITRHISGSKKIKKKSSNRVYCLLQRLHKEVQDFRDPANGGTKTRRTSESLFHFYLQLREKPLVIL